MLQVKQDLCLGCGLCAESCPQQAISLPLGQAEIYQSRCNHCGLCLDVCPQGAIIELTPVSIGELQATVTVLEDRANDIISRIEKLRSSNRNLNRR
jgi:ferredoxin